MDTPPAEQSKRNADEFLLAEYRYLTESLWRNEETGERRVNFFISLVTAVIGALVAFATTKESALDPGLIKAITIYAVLALFLLGLVTLQRLVKRNLVTDGYKRSMDTIREHYKQADGRLTSYAPFPPIPSRKPGQGGLAEMVSLINSLLAAALAAIITYPAPVLVIGVSGLAGLIVSLVAQRLYMQRRYQLASRNTLSDK